MKSFLTTISLLLLLVVLHVDVTAQYRFMNHQSMALGGASTAVVGDFNALFTNPANIYNRRKNTSVTVGLAPLNLQLGGPLLSWTAYNDYLTSGTNYSVNEWNNEVIPAFFDGDAPKYFGLGVDVVPLGFSFGNENFALAFAVRSRVLMDFNMDSGLLKLGAGLNETNFGTPTPMNQNVSVTGLAEISVGYSMPIYELESDFGDFKVIAGIAPKILLGISHADVNLNSTIQVDAGNSITHDFEYSIAGNGISEGFDDYLAAKAADPDLKLTQLFDNYFEFNSSGIGGTGFGLDVGATVEWDQNFIEDVEFLASFSLTDIGSVNFDQNFGTYQSSGQFLFSGVEYDEERIEQDFDDSIGDYFEYVVSDSLAEKAYNNLEKTGSSKTVNLPTMFNLGFLAKWKLLTVTTDFSQGFEDYGLNSTTMFWSTGLEVRPLSFLPFRFGTRVGGNSSVAYSFGTGLDFKNYQFSFGAIATTSGVDNGMHLGFALSAFTIRF